MWISEHVKKGDFSQFNAQKNKSSRKAEAATRGALKQKLFLEISQNSQENICATASFLIKLLAEAWGL